MALLQIALMRSLKTWRNQLKGESIIFYVPCLKNGRLIWYMYVHMYRLSKLSSANQMSELRDFVEATFMLLRTVVEVIYIYMLVCVFDINHLHTHNCYYLISDL